MATPDLILGTQNGTGPDTCGTVSLPLNPFVANRYHFGMLLGVADLDAEQAYHRGKAWLHAAWLHGPGTVWGLGVAVRAEAGEVEVQPGLALDRNGRELRVAERQCLDLGRWFVDRRPDDLEVTEQEDGSVTFDVHVTLCADSCLDRPVPSISEPCSGAGFGNDDTDTAYSRSVERGLPDLAAGRAPADPVAPYLRLRQLFGQLPAEDATVLEAQTAIDAAADADRAGEFLRWFRRLAALDTVDLHPDGGIGELFPSDGSSTEANGCIPLADLAVHLRPDGDRWVVVDDGDTPTAVDNTVRPAHVRTRTIQELLSRSGAPDPGVRADRADRARGGERRGPPRGLRLGRRQRLDRAPLVRPADARLHGHPGRVQRHGPAPRRVGGRPRDGDRARRRRHDRHAPAAFGAPRQAAARPRPRRRPHTPAVHRRATPVRDGRRRLHLRQRGRRRPDPRRREGRRCRRGARVRVRIRVRDRVRTP